MRRNIKYTAFTTVLSGNQFQKYCTVYWKVGISTRRISLRDQLQ